MGMKAAGGSLAAPNAGLDIERYQEDAGNGGQAVIGRARATTASVGVTKRVRY